MSTDIPATESGRKTEFDLLRQAVDHERQADHHWFAANPRRTIRIRQSYPNEARRSALLSVNPLPAGAKRFVLVRRLNPRGLAYISFGRRSGFTPPLTEAGARRVWGCLSAAGATLYGAPIDLAVAIAETVLNEAA
jgi:hypothetical protein